MQKINTRIINKHDTETNWNSCKAIPMNGELIIYDVDGDHKRPRVKIGDGETLPKDLSYIDTGLNLENSAAIYTLYDKGLPSNAVQGPLEVSSPVTIDDGENAVIRAGDTLRTARATGYQAFAFGGPRFDSLDYFYAKIDLGEGSYYYDFHFGMENINGDTKGVWYATHPGHRTHKFIDAAYGHPSVDGYIFIDEADSTNKVHEFSKEYIAVENGRETKEIKLPPTTEANGAQSFAFGGGNVANAKWDFTAGKVNTVNSALSFVLGSANKVGVAGKDENSQQNNIIVGATNNIGVCPSSAIIGTGLNLNVESNADCKASAVFGQNITAKEFSQSLVAGRLHNIDAYRTLVFGHANKVRKCSDEGRENSGDNIISAVNGKISGGRGNALFGNGIHIGDGENDCKSYNSLITGNGTFANWANHCVAAGNYSGVQGDKEKYVSNTFVFGSNLRTRLSDAFIIGKNHSDVAGARFIVGDGDSENNRKNLLTVTSDKTVVNNTLETKNIDVCGAKVDIGSAELIQASGYLELAGGKIISYPSDDLVKITKLTISEGLSVVGAATKCSFEGPVHCNDEFRAGTMCIQGSTITTTGGLSIDTGTGTISGATIDAINSDITRVNNDISAINNDISVIDSDISAINTTFENFNGRNILTGTLDSSGILHIELVSYNQATLHEV
jgi:hypothetical protein